MPIGLGFLNLDSFQVLVFVLSGVSWCHQVLDIFRTPFAQYREQDVVSHMPRVSQTEPWIKPFRRQVAVTCGEDWYVRNNRGRLRLEVRGAGTVALNFDWTERGAALALPFIQQMFKRWDGGRITLAAATQSTKTSGSNQKLDFTQLVDAFHKFVPYAGDKTWKENYMPVLRNCRDQFKGKTPRDGEALCIAALSQWDQGTRMRQISRRVLFKFLDWAVRRGHLKPIYSPPARLPETLKPKRIGYPLSDAQILSLIESIPDPRWQFAVQLLAVYGLRPEELRWLRIKDGALWCIYEKSMGGIKGQKTEPRRLHPLFVRDVDGTAIDWKLQARLQIGEELPPLRTEGKGAQAVTSYLRRRKTWMAMIEEADHAGEQLTTYSFRHRYAKESHTKNLPVANIAEAMGHTMEVHLKNYGRFKPSGTGNLYAEVNV